MTIQMNDEVKKIGRWRVVSSQVLACLSLDFLLVGLGMSISFVTMVLPEVLDAKEGLSINKKQASWFGSMAFLCQPVGSIFSGPLLDYFGRKKALFLVNIPHLIAWLLMYYAWNVPSLFVGNALLGIGIGIMEAPSVTYVGEVTDPSIRGCLTTLTNGFTSAGMFVAYLLGTVLPWRQAALVSLSVPLATMALVLLVPETPIWLLSKGRQKDALNSLCRLRGWVKPEDVKEEFEELLRYNDLNKQCIVCARDGESETGSCEHMNCGFVEKIILKFKHVFFVKETIRPFTLVMAYFLFHSLSGLIPVRPNLVNFCKALGMKYDAKTFVVIVGAVLILMNIISAVIVKTIGKRKLVVGSLLATAICSLSISVYASIKIPISVFSYEASTFPESKDMLPVVLLMALVCVTSLGIPWILLSEVFPFRSRGMATGLAAAFNYVIVFLATKTNYNLEASFHISGTFAIYAIITFIGTMYLYLYLPETENKSLAEIEAYYKGNQKIFANDCLINAFRKKNPTNIDVVKPMLVN
ncbi:PREDICTED: facilitated trehalose transporter Tret1-like [Papilio xuthus]|uniref:Facilitated trehalose transporter Tret1-like n=3 Tax=Papilio xuthus TaxID=66420 RepID=A0AAJ7E7F7_PAPXU|nr:PREDICTED: facilitated trehalose transporter Tret1-like [Papilio xuthus]XP_013165964.1 PREDICTED: facilitated trehalose transporter Tret1-like [Papilio xuthus]XP_013165965.1 PREDICTED: facilitated trehalose transporter Tret1-like [Papilio xuthus]XP_013165966.1 PREDICTED: facilitated trehalose transporter Tret1-like [Papilio xuthus]